MLKTLFKRLGTRAANFDNSYPKTSTGTLTHAPADSADRACMIMVEVLETFANGSGAQPTFSIGETTLATKFTATSLLTNAKAGQKFLIGGINVAARAILVTAVAGTGTSTGAIRVTVATLPTALV